MLRNVPIRSKLLATLVGPLLVLSVLALVGIRANMTDSARAARVNQLARFAGSLAPLVHGLQAERSLSSGYLASDRRAGFEQLDAKRHEVDRMVATYRAAAARLDLPAADRHLLDKVNYGLRELGRLAEQRRAVDAFPLDLDQAGVEPRLDRAEEEGEVNLAANHGPINSPDKALDQYTDSVNDLLDVNSEIGQGAGDAALLKSVAASVALARAKDFADLQRGLLNQVFIAGRFSSGQYGRLAALVAAEDVYQGQFVNAASAEQRELLERTVTGPDVARADRLVGLALDGEHAGRLGVDARAWFRSMTAKVDLERRVERQLSADVVATSAAVEARADRRALSFTVLLVIALAAAVVLLLITASALIRPLERLRDAADDVAERALPGIVRRLQAGEDVDLAAEAAAPITLESRDELGRLARAFNSVHRVAVQLAGEEATLRRSISDMFLNLARRSQAMIERQLELIAELRRQQPARGAHDDLAELDHLATRMRRNAASLIMLSGAETSLRWRGPVAFADVVRAAVGEVKAYDRVHARVVERHLVGHAAGDLVHLLAELIENAMWFSAPGTRAFVTGQALPAGYLLEVEDQGVGMTDVELAKVNERLANPPLVDFADAKMLGFLVVGHLAARHGIKVMLRHSGYGGITALVLLPAGLVAESANGAPPHGASRARPQDGGGGGSQPLGPPGHWGGGGSSLRPR